MGMIRRRAKPNRRLVDGPGNPVWGKTLLRSVAVMVVLLSGCGGYWYGSQASSSDLRRLIVWADQLFPITSIEISDNRTISRDEVLALLDLEARAGLLSADPKKLTQTLEAHPWIQQAEIRRVFPNTLVVELKEREPTAVLRTGERELLLGQDGAVIAEASTGAYQGFPILTGVAYADAVSRKSDATERLLAGIALANLLAEAGASRMEVDLRTAGDMVAYYDGFRIRFGDGALEDKVERYRRLSEQLPDRSKQRETPGRSTELGCVGSGGGSSRTGPPPAMEERGERVEESSTGCDATMMPGLPHSKLKQGDVEMDLRFQDRVIVRDKGGKRVWGEKTKSS
jgi:cell division septal protein FtsQ